MDHLSDVSALSADIAAVDCGEDPVASLKQMFVDIVMGRRIVVGQQPALRPVFLKQHGVAFGTFSIRPDLPEDLRVGIFAQQQFMAMVRLRRRGTAPHAQSRFHQRTHATIAHATAYVS